MGVVAIVLVLLMFTIQMLGLFDRLAERRQAAGIAGAVLEASGGAAVTPVASSSAPGPREVSAGGEIVAAIAVALALGEEDELRAAPGFPGVPAYGRAIAGDAWAAAGRRKLMDRRGRPSR